MTKVMKIVASGLLALTLSVTYASAEGKGMQMSGALEAGYAASFGGGASTNGFLLDYARMNMEHHASDTVKVVFNNAFSVQNGTPFTTNHNSSAYFSGATIGTAGAGMSLIYSNMAAYVDFKCADKVHTWVGHFSTPFGMESMWERWNMGAYYYSQTYTNLFRSTAGGFGWNQDLGLKLALIDVLPGTFEAAILNDMNVGTSTPALALRWSYEMKSGDSSLTPVLSAYFGNFQNNTDLGLSAGAMWKMGAIHVNGEFLFGRRGTAQWGVIVEPGFDAGFAKIAAKFELESRDASNTNDFNLGATLSHEYAGGYRIRLAYNHVGLRNTLNNHANDVRLLFGVKW